MAKARALARARRRARRARGGGATPSANKAGAPSTPSLTPVVKRGAARGRGAQEEEGDAVLDLETPRRPH